MEPNREVEKVGIEKDESADGVVVVSFPTATEVTAAFGPVAGKVNVADVLNCVAGGMINLV